MNRLLALGAVLALSFLVTPLVSAQGFNPEQMRERLMAQVDEAVAELALDGEVADTVRAILVKRVETRFELMSEMRGGGGDRGAMRAKMAEIDEKVAASLSDVLTEEQFAKWKEIDGRRRQMGMRRRGN